MSEANQRIEVELSIGGDSVLARKARVEEGMSELGGAWVDVALGSDLDIPSSLEGEAVLAILHGGREVRRFTMQVAGGRFVDERDGHLRYRVELRPALWFLRLGKNTRKFRDVTAQTIVSTILGEGGVSHRWQLTRSPASRPYCVQYRESNLDFVLRLLEFEGIYYFFEPDGTLVLGDASGSLPQVAGKAVYTLAEGAAALTHGDFEVHAFSRGAAVGTGMATVNDYSWKKPALSLLASANGRRDTHLEVYDYPTGYRDPGMGTVLAQLRLEAFEAGKDFVEGSGTVPFFAAGRLFDFSHDEAISFSGSYLLTRVVHHFSTGEDGHIRYENSWQGQPAASPFRPQLVTPHPVVAGCHTVMVRGPAGEEIHTDCYGRAKVQFNWDREAKGTDEDSRWIRVLQEISSSIALARVGWEISVGYINGDPDRPVGLARQINGQMVPTYSQPANKNRMTIRTETYPGKAGYCELRMDDSAGAMAMDWHSQKDFRAIIRRNRTEKIGNNLTVLIQKDSERLVEQNQSIEIGTDLVQNISRDVNLKVDLDRSHSTGGSEKVDVADSATVMVNGNDSETVGGLRFTATGSFGVSIPNPKELLQSLVPSASDIVGNVAGAAFGDTIGSIAGSAASSLGGALAGGGEIDGGALGGAVGGALGGALGGSGGSTLGGIAGGALGGALSGGGAGGALDGALGGGGGSGALEGAVGGALDGVLDGGGAGGALDGALSGALGGGGGGGGFGGSFTGGGGGGLGGGSGGGGMGDIGAALQSSLPSGEALLSKATGGLSDIRSISDLTALCKGCIDRTVQERFMQMVGGAKVVLAGSPISHDAGKLLVEAVGGAKLTLTAKEGILQGVSGYLLTTVGGLIMRKSKGDMSMSAGMSSVTVGATATFSSEERIELRSTDISIEAKSQLTLKADDLIIDMTPGEVKIDGSLKLESDDKIKLRGNPDLLTA